MCAGTLESRDAAGSPEDALPKTATCIMRAHASAEIAYGGRIAQGTTGDEPEQSGQGRRRRVCCSCNASGWRWWLDAGGQEYLRRMIPPPVSVRPGHK